MGLAPSHTVADLVWSQLTLVLGSEHLTVFISCNSINFLDTFWKVWVWVPFTFKARVVTGHWNGGGKLKSFITGWVTSKLAGRFVVRASDLTVDWSIKMSTFMALGDTRWVPKTTSWKSWLIFTGFKVTDIELSRFSSIAIITLKADNLDIIVNFGLDRAVDW
jgi:hypothetical protein